MHDTIILAIMNYANRQIFNKHLSTSQRTTLFKSQHLTALCQKSPKTTISTHHFTSPAVTILQYNTVYHSQRSTRPFTKDTEFPIDVLNTCSIVTYSVIR